MRCALEREASRIEADIARAEAQMDYHDVLGRDVADYAEQTREVMLKPSLLLEEDVALERRRSRFNIVFDGLPSIDELNSGTAKCGELVGLSTRANSMKDVLVRLQRLSWNQLKSEILRAQEICAV